MQKKRSKIMLVDDIVTNLSAGRNLLRMFYEVYPVTSAAKLFELLENVIPDLILLDIEMPEMDGYEAIKILKSNERFSDIPVIFLTSKTDENSELEGLNLGAVDYISKPFAGPLLLKRIETHLLIEQQRKVLLKQQAELKDYNDNLQQLVHKKTTQVLELQNAVMSTVAELVEFRDDVTGGHIARTQHYLKCLIEALIEEGIYQEEVSSWDLDFLLPSAQLHDVGKIAISDLILNKPGKLTPEEFDIMKSHVTIGVNALEQIENNTEEHEFMHHAKIIAGTHHEKWDGSGYPLGLSGLNIPLEGRLMAIADVYDALISTRPYKKPFSTDEAKKIIIEGSGAHFDPVLVEVFKRVAPKFVEIATETA